MISFSASLMAVFRGVGLLSRFAINIFIAKEFGATKLGIFSLVMGVAAFAPAILGFGLNGTIYRDMVGASRHRAMMMASSKTALTLIIYTLIFVILFITWVLSQIPTELIGYLAIISSDHILSDIYGFFISRKRPIFANYFMFTRTAIWPIACILIYSFFIKFDFWILFLAWLIANTVSTFLILGELLKAERYKDVVVDFAWCFRAIRQSHLFYAYDVGNAGYLYSDRFVVTAALGLEAAGIYSLVSAIITSIVLVIYTAFTQPNMPFLVEKRRELQEYKKYVSDLSKHILGYSIIPLSVIPAAQIYLYYVAHPPIANELAVFALAMSLAIPVRSQSELYHLVLYCAREDILMTSSAFVGMLLSILLTFIGSYFYGILGAGLSFLSSSFILLLLRLIMVRRLFFSPGRGATG